MEIVWSIVLIILGGLVIRFRKPFAGRLARSYPNDSADLFEALGVMSLIPVGLFFIGVGIYLLLTVLRG